MPSESTPVLVTGASGFVGLNCVAKLLERGSTVIALAADAMPPAALAEFSAMPGSLAAVQADIRDVDRMAEVIVSNEVAVVIHGAAITADAERERSSASHIVDVNVAGTQAVLDASLAGRVDRIVYVSSGAVYGPATFGSDPIDESTPPDPTTLYGITKRTGEELVRRYGELHGPTVTVARLSAVYGPWERDTGLRDSLSPQYQVAQFLRRGAAVRLPDQDAARNWLYSRDAAAALVGLALRRGPRHLVYNVAPSTTFPVRAWAQHLAAAVPGFTISPDGEELHFDADPSLPRVPVRNDRLRAELEGWPLFDSPRAFDDYLTWLRSHPDWT